MTVRKVADSLAGGRLIPSRLHRHVRQAYAQPVPKGRKGSHLHQVEHAIVVKGDDKPNGDIADLHQPGEQREADPGSDYAGTCETIVDRQSAVQGERS